MKLKSLFLSLISIFYVSTIFAASVSNDVLQELKGKSVYAIQYVSPSQAPELESVKNKFLENLKSNHVIANFQNLTYVYLSDDLPYLKSGFSEGWVFDFKKESSGDLRVRLIQFPDSSVVWEKSCHEMTSCAQSLTDDFVSSADQVKEQAATQSNEVKSLPPPPVLEEAIPDSLFPDHGIYIDGGIGYAILLKSDDRRFVKDSVWFNSRVGYQISQKIGLHLEMGYSPISLKTSSPSSAYYFFIAPGVKCTIPIQEHLSIFVSGTLGYGRIKAQTTTASASASGLHFGTEVGMTYKFNQWVGISPYLGLPSIMDAHSSSVWFLPGIMGSLSF